VAAVLVPLFVPPPPPPSPTPSAASFLSFPSFLGSLVLWQFHGFLSFFLFVPFRSFVRPLERFTVVQFSLSLSPAPPSPFRWDRVDRLAETKIVTWETKRGHNVIKENILAQEQTKYLE
jgi:hypothetical protein